MGCSLEWTTWVWEWGIVLGKWTSQGATFSSEWRELQLCPVIWPHPAFLTSPPFLSSRSTSKQTSQSCLCTWLTLFSLFRMSSFSYSPGARCILPISRPRLVHTSSRQLPLASSSVRVVERRETLQLPRAGPKLLLCCFLAVWHWAQGTSPLWGSISFLGNGDNNSTSLPSLLNNYMRHSL